MDDSLAHSVHLTERTLQLALFRMLQSGTCIAIPNYTPAGWHECDLWAVTKAGYGLEYEIKMSIGDFRADASKSTGPRWRLRLGKWENLGALSKHERLSSGDTAGPSRFYFVAPAGLLPLEDIPPWAGFVEFKSSARRWLPDLEVIRNGPRLHTAKVSQESMRRAERVCYWRFWNEATRVQRAIHDHLIIRDRDLRLAGNAHG